MVHNTDGVICGSGSSAGSLLESPVHVVQLAGPLLMSFAEPTEKKDHVLRPEDIMQDSDNLNNKRNTGDATDSYGYTGDAVDSVPSRIPPHSEDYEYHMAHPERGCFIIFNQEKFDPHLNLEVRTGTRTDAYNMYQVARHMGFQYIKTLHNCKREDILGWMAQVSQASHHTYDSFGCAILTHGGENDELYASDADFKLSDCTEMFQADKCPSLAGKPKLFFIQACRGTKRDTGSKLHLMNLSNPFPKVATAIPNQADFLIARCTTPGHMAWRNRANGSWFVQSLHHCFTRYSKTLELMQIMTRVNNRVAYFESHCKEGNDGYKQIPSISSQLTGEVFFFRTKVEPNILPVCDSQASVDIVNSQIEESGNGLSSAEPPKKKSVIKRMKSIGKSFRKRKSTKKEKKLRLVAL